MTEEIDAKLLPGEKELHALRRFVSQDTTRPHLASLWRYTGEGGATYVATDGHTIAVRRSGTHRTMHLWDIAKLQPQWVCLADGSVPDSARWEPRDPPRWAEVCVPHATGAPKSAYSMNPDYFARLGIVERAAGAREADDYIPGPRETKKDTAKARANVRESANTRLTIPRDPLDGWHWTLTMPAALWEGVLMPRRA